MSAAGLPVAGQAAGGRRAVRPLLGARLVFSRSSLADSPHAAEFSGSTCRADVRRSPRSPSRSRNRIRRLGWLGRSGGSTAEQESRGTSPAAGGRTGVRAVVERPGRARSAAVGSTAAPFLYASAAAETMAVDARGGCTPLGTEVRAKPARQSARLLPTGAKDPPWPGRRRVPGWRPRRRAALLRRLHHPRRRARGRHRLLQRAAAGVQRGGDVPPGDPISSEIYTSVHSVHFDGRGCGFRSRRSCCGTCSRVAASSRRGSIPLSGGTQLNGALGVTRRPTGCSGSRTGATGSTRWRRAPARCRAPG